MNDYGAAAATGLGITIAGVYLDGMGLILAALAVVAGVAAAIRLRHRRGKSVGES